MTICTPEKITRGMALAMERAARGERVIVKRRNKSPVAIVPVEDAEYMERLEDAQDIAAAKKALKEPGFITWDAIKKKHGL